MATIGAFVRTAPYTATSRLTSKTTCDGRGGNFHWSAPAMQSMVAHYRGSAQLMTILAKLATALS